MIYRSAAFVLFVTSCLIYWKRHDPVDAIFTLALAFFWLAVAYDYSRNIKRPKRRDLWW